MSMDATISAISNMALEEAAQAAQVKVLDKSLDQSEAVMNKLISGMEEVSRSLPSHKGQRINIVA